MSSEATRRARALAALGPLASLVVLAAILAARSAEPGRMTLELAWAPPGPGRPLGSGDAGLELGALVGHATLRALGLAAVVSCVGFGVGLPLGAAAGLARGRAERAVLGVCDLVQAFPTFLLALAVLSAVATPSRLHIGLVFAVTAWAPFARLAAAQARVLADAQFVEAARALGVSRFRTVARHVLPNLLGTVAIQLGTSAAGLVLGEAALGFVGLGPADGVSLGALLEQGTLGMLRAPHVLAVGAAAVAAASFSLQLASEGLRRWAHG
ncbi:MAG: ABC transporter permease subunit [Polyangiaceae bacterium]|nr:ABC transporter permease subunit [Polyangiaceae bacterium]